MDWNVLSLFDGISCGLVALKSVGINVGSYFASETDAHAMSISKNNHPEVKHIGSVCEVKASELPFIDLLIGGSPCQGFSLAGKRLNFGDPRSALFFEYLRVLEEIREYNPNVKFLLENVIMDKEIQNAISKLLGCDPVLINSALVSAQTRKRLYWTNIANIVQPVNTNRSLSTILEDLPDCPIGISVREKSKCIRVGGRNSPFGGKQEWDSPFQRVTKKGKLKPGIEKSACLTGGANSGGNHSDMDIIHTPFATRRYSVVECERLMGLPDGYTKGVSNTQAYKALGNGWQVDTIKHIFLQHEF